MHSVLKSVFFLSFFICGKAGAALTKPLKFNYVTTSEGQVYPGSVKAAYSEDVIFHLLTLPLDFDQCQLINPRENKVYIVKPGRPNGRYEYWNPLGMNNGCGVRMKNVAKTDGGRWKLVARNKGNKISQSYIKITILDREQPSPIFYLREHESAVLNLSNSADYCDIKRLIPSYTHTVFDYCRINIDSVTKSLEGIWNVQAGVEGQVKETNIRTTIRVAKEDFVVGLNITKDNLYLHCNVQNLLDATYRYCRFVRSDNKVALHLKEGLSDGKYSYFGNGLIHGDCGLSIDNPTPADFTVWRCHIGITQYKKMFTKDSLIYVPRDRTTRDDQNKEQIILGGAKTSLTLLCESNYRLKYCWFKHPNGIVINTKRDMETGLYESYGVLTAGECGLTIINVTVNETGRWTCHMSPYDSVGLDEIRTLNVRVGETPLVAFENQIETKKNAKIVLACKIMALLTALEYCRFWLPNGNSFSIDSTIKENNAIQGLYWYSGTSLADGDCQITVKKTYEEHNGTWSCAGKLVDEDAPEYYDYIQVKVTNAVANPDLGNMDTTSILIISFGVGGGLFIVIVIIIVYRVKKRRINAADADSRSSTSSNDVNAHINVQNNTEPTVQRSTIQNISGVDDFSESTGLGVSEIRIERNYRTLDY